MVGGGVQLDLLSEVLGSGVGSKRLLVERPGMRS